MENDTFIKLSFYMTSTLFLLVGYCLKPKFTTGKLLFCMNANSEVFISEDIHAIQIQKWEYT